MQTYVTGVPMACIVYGTMFMGNEELLMFATTRDFNLLAAKTILEGVRLMMIS